MFGAFRLLVTESTDTVEAAETDVGADDAAPDTAPEEMPVLAEMNERSLSAEAELGLGANDPA